MKISSGWAKNLPILTPAGLGTRPTRSRVREAIISSLQFRIPGAVIVDCFAGSGALGIEMLSRGAGSCLFIEKDPSALAQLRQNLRNLERRAQSAGVEKPKYTVLNLDLERTPIAWPREYQAVDIFWADPPYDLVLAWAEGVLKRSEAFPNVNGVLAIELRTSDSLSLEKLTEESAKFRLKNSKRYGETTIMFLEAIHPSAGEVK